MQIISSPNLIPYIKHYLFLDLINIDNGLFRTFADGNTGIVFSIGSGALYRDGIKLPKVFCYGQITDYRELQTIGSLKLIIAVFRPFGMSKILNTSAGELKNKIIDLESVLGNNVRTLDDFLCKKVSNLEVAESLNSFFSQLLKEFETRLYPMVMAATNWIMERNGLFKAEELIDFTGYNQRNIERAFHNLVGIAPKKLGSIIKLHHFLGEIKGTGSKYNFTSNVFDAGYFDQAHLIREFRKITGLTPTTYHVKSTHLAVNVIVLPDENVQS
jgi:AraC-like DNA-binding protein